MLNRRKKSNQIKCSIKPEKAGEEAKIFKKKQV